MSDLGGRSAVESPVVPTGARALLEPMEPVGVSYHQHPLEDSRQALEEVMAVSAHPQVLVHPDHLVLSVAVAQKPQPDGEPLAVPPQALYTRLLVDVVQRKLRVGAVPELLPHPPLDVPQDAADVAGLRVRVVAAAVEEVQLLVELHPAAPALLLEPPAPHGVSYLVARTPVAGLREDVGQHDVVHWVVAVDGEEDVACLPAHGDALVHPARAQERLPYADGRCHGHRQDEVPCLPELSCAAEEVDHARIVLCFPAFLQDP